MCLNTASDARGPVPSIKESHNHGLPIFQVIPVRTEGKQNNNYAYKTFRDLEIKRFRTKRLLTLKRE